MISGPGLKFGQELKNLPAELGEEQINPTVRRSGSVSISAEGSDGHNHD